MMTRYLNLFVQYAQLNILLSSIEERRIITAVYYKLFSYIRTMNEPNFARCAMRSLLLSFPVYSLFSCLLLSSPLYLLPLFPAAFRFFRFDLVYVSI